jgi:hypothetical protein
MPTIRSAEFRVEYNSPGVERALMRVKESNQKEELKICSIQSIAFNLAMSRSFGLRLIALQRSATTTLSQFANFSIIHLYRLWPLVASFPKPTLSSMPSNSLNSNKVRTLKWGIHRNSSIATCNT